MKKEERTTRQFLQKRGIVGVGEGEKFVRNAPTGDKAIVFAVVKKKPNAKVSPGDRIPKKLHGLPTDVIETGEIKALPVSVPQEGNGTNSGRQKPFMCGDEVGPIYPDQAGTLGLILRMPFWEGGEKYRDIAITNWHVVHNSLSGMGASTVGTIVTHPRVDQSQGSPVVIGKVIRDTPVRSNMPNHTDVALIHLTQPGDEDQWLDGHAWDFYNDETFGHEIPWNPLAFPHEHENYSSRIRDAASPLGFQPAARGMSPIEVGTPAWKSGRTTGLTYAHCVSTTFTCVVKYHSGSAMFLDQLLFKAYEGNEASGPGDSGSGVITRDHAICGLLFAGSSSVFVANNIQTIFKRLCNHWELERLDIDQRSRMLPAA